MDFLNLVMNSGFLKPILWLILIFGLALMGVGALWLRKQRKLEYKCLILSQVGNRKASVVLTKAGWFKNNMILKLWDYGTEEKIRAKDGRVVYGLTREDMHFFKGNRCILCMEKGDDKKVLVPIKWVDLEEKSRTMINAIAPVDLRDVSSQIIAKNATELRSNAMQYIQIALLAGLIIFCIIGIILVTQMVNNGQAEAKDLILQSMQFSCDQARTAVASLAP